jgi:transcription termination factor NusB
MLKFSKLNEYQLLEVQEDLKNIFMLKKNNYIKDLNDEEIEDIKYYQRLFKGISDELEDIDL